MFDTQRIFHTGMVVADLAAAQRDIGASLGLDWTPVRRFGPMPFWTPEQGLHEIESQAVYSRQGPHHIEILQGPKGSFYDPDRLPDGRHIGVWVDDLRAAAEDLIAQGWRACAAGGAPEDGYGAFAYLAPASGGLIVELVCHSLKPMIDAWLVER